MEARCCIDDCNQLQLEANSYDESHSEAADNFVFPAWPSFSEQHTGLTAEPQYPHISQAGWCALREAVH